MGLVNIIGIVSFLPMCAFGTTFVQVYKKVYENRDCGLNNSAKRVKAESLIQCGIECAAETGCRTVGYSAAGLAPGSTYTCQLLTETVEDLSVIGNSAGKCTYFAVSDATVSASTQPAPQSTSTPCVMQQYTEFQGKYYKIPGDCGTGDPLQHNWDDAQAYCVAEGGNLAIIETLAENDFVENYFKAHPEYFGSIATDGLWVSLHEASPGNWEWVRDGAAGIDVTSGFQHWCGSYVNDHQDDDCGLIYTGCGFKWIDQNCIYPMKFLCERDTP